MGTCVSKPDNSLKNSPKYDGNVKKKKKTKKQLKRKVSSHLSAHSLEKRISEEPAVSDQASHVTVPTSVQEARFDSRLALETDSEEDFHSVQSDSFLSCMATPKSINSEARLVLPFIYLAITFLLAMISTPKELELKRLSRMPLQKPIAGGQVPFCSIDKRILDSWSHIEPSTFRVRAQNYLRDKKKEPASNFAAYYPIGVDVFLSPRKVNHIARFVKLPVADVSGEFPSFLVVNAQIPKYPPSLFQNQSDGDGFNIVLYFKLNENFLEELPSHFQENFKKLINGEEEKVKGFASETVVPFRERLKILGRVQNVEELPINSAERKIMNTYNGKPLLSRPQHEFFLGQNHFEIDLDMHRFSYISRKGFGTFLDRLKLCILDFGLTIQGNKAEELSEQILCCIRLNGIDYNNYQQLGISEESLSLYS